MVKNYSFNKDVGKYKVSKMIRGKRIHFGMFRTEEQAIRAVELYNELGWDKELRWIVRSRVLEETLNQ